MKGYSEGIVASAALIMVLLMIFPLSPFFLDLMLCVNLLLSVMTFFLVISIAEPLEFNTFPSLLLFLTLFRLGLNIASTRMILAHGEAGDIIQTFGQFVTEGNLFIGIIIFVLITLINFIVITKGAGRIAEVAARFALEALAGKQLAIDRELEGGILNPSESMMARAKVASHAEFYGAMDGASKFVRGDAIAGILIVIVNLLGGILIGGFAGQSFLESFGLYASLTIGDGLVTQIPALLISLSGAFMVSRASEGNLASSLLTQLTQYPKVIFMGGLALLLFSLTPGMPHVLMISISIPLLFIPFLAKKKQQEKKEEQGHQIELFLGLHLLSYGESLLAECTKMREKIALKIGFSIPSVSIKDHLSLPSHHFQIKIKGATVHFGEGDHASIIKTLSEKIYQHAHELLRRQDVAEMIEGIKKNDPLLIEELIPKKLTLGSLFQILQNLLKEGCPVKDLLTILETCAESKESIEVELIIETIRQRLSKSMIEDYLDGERVLHTITFDPKVEQLLSASLKKGPNGTTLGLRPTVAEKMEKEIATLMKKRGSKMALLTSSTVRRSLSRLFEKEIKELKIFSYDEVQGVNIQNVGSISTEVLI